MEKQQIIENLKELVKPLLDEEEAAAVDAIKEDTNIALELGLDSVDMVEVIMGMENTFGISIADEEIQKIETVNDIVALVQAKQASNASETK